MNQSAAAARLRSQVEAVKSDTNRYDLPDLWPTLREWFLLEVEGPVGNLAFECMVLPTVSREGYPEAPDGFECDEVFCLEAFREFADGPNVGIGFYYPTDPDWTRLLESGELRRDHPFVWEVCQRDREHAPFLELAEASGFFQLAYRKRATLTVVFDTGADTDLEYRITSP